MPSDCPTPANECQVPTCVNAACGVANAPSGAPVANQVPGDCQRLVCDGSGGTTQEIDDTDIHDDGLDCTLEGCSAGVPTSNPAPAGTACDDASGVVCDGAGACVLSFCGDGVVSGNEVCDDGNQNDCDGCRADCSAMETGCGDGFVCGAETCDDGNTVGGDGCSAVCTAEGVIAVAPGELHTCALLGDGTVKCWGANTAGRLGLGDTAHRGDGAGEMGASLPAVDLGTGELAVAIAAGGSHTCALLAGGSIKCWGSNSFGELGLGDTAHRGDEPGEMGDALPAVDLGTGRTATALTVGYRHACALLDDGSVKCWGSGQNGRLGLGDTASRGNGNGQMGDLLPTVDLGTGRTAKAISAGAFHTCVVLDDDSVKCWGVNSRGQLGLGDMLLRGDEPGEMGNALPVVALGAGRTAKAITTGYEHTCALLDDDRVKCWGNGFNGRLGQGDQEHRGDGPGEMGNALPAVDLGTGLTARSIRAGEFHTCALLSNATVKCWGMGTYGQLGLGDNAHRGDAAGEMGDALPAVDLGAGFSIAAVHVGAQHSCARSQTATVKCWGHGGQGRLGQGNTANRGKAAGEMGDQLPVIPVL
ncbi:uncharacterized protein CMC5_013170 [Chondromyces crocatus]|uniref:RCC1-like domain-containing protein n=2 Tax=Chondromyces crocatus TaxID=52 RepID=A0A0K1E936_CHOCO|nr:uncharacterized protein CMC5_013170 [Chondromyces crocatus]